MNPFYTGVAIGIILGVLLVLLAAMCVAERKETGRSREVPPPNFPPPPPPPVQPREGGKE